MRFMSLLLVACFTSPVAAAPVPFPEFKVQEIDKTLKVGYGVRIADLNADAKPDIIVADAARVIWFDNAGGWKLHTIIENAKAGVKADNVCLDIHDIDGDGKLDIALGADWQPTNTRTGGSLQWLRQGKTIGEWTVHKIAESIPTLHRVHFIDGGRTLVVVPLKGERSTPAADVPVRVLAYSILKDATSEWKPAVLNEQLHTIHNVRGTENAILTASAEGVGALENGKWKQLGAGNQDNPKASRGSGEVSAGRIDNAAGFMAAIEPMHGHQVVAYDSKSGGRAVIDDQLQAGHALWCADLDGDGTDEVVAGFREPTAAGIGPGINIYKISGNARNDVPRTWQKHVLDDKGIACEDLTCADLNADGKLDIIGVGRATGNVRIYWNQGIPKD